MNPINAEAYGFDMYAFVEFDNDLFTSEDITDDFEDALIESLKQQVGGSLILTISDAEDEEEEDEGEEESSQAVNMTWNEARVHLQRVKQFLVSKVLSDACDKLESLNASLDRYALDNRQMSKTNTCYRLF
jgi:arginyl-tRNA synthetase